MNGLVYVPDILFNTTTLKKIYLYIGTSPFDKRNQGLSLGYHDLNESFSMIHSFYQQKLINHLQFAFCNLSKKFISIGSISLNAHLSMKNKGIISINEELPTWGFTLTEIIIDNKTTTFNIPTIINSCISNMFISNEIYSFIVDNLFIKLIETNECSRKKYTWTDFKL